MVSFILIKLLLLYFILYSIILSNTIFHIIVINNIIYYLLSNNIHYNYIWLICIPTLIIQIIIIDKTFKILEIDYLIILYNKIIYNIDLLFNKIYECPICFDNIDNNDLYEIKCGHKFHLTCISKWNRNTCPLCRGNIIY